MGEESYDYKCSKGHAFRSKAAIRAFCPKCGESVRRAKSETDKEIDNSSVDEIHVGGNADGDAKAKGNEKEQSKESEKEEETERKEPVRTKVIRVKRKEPDKDEEMPKNDGRSKSGDRHRDSSSDNDDSRKRLIKRRRIRQRYSHPKVKGRVKTNKESADEKTNKTQSLTTWEKIRVRAGFGS